MRTRSTATGLAALAAIVLLAAAVAAAAPAAGQPTAPDYTEAANHTVDLPHTSDHYPGNRNPGNATMHDWFAGKGGLEAEGAGDGIWVDSYAIRADWIDYSACDATNVDVFGVDRGNDNAGTTVDEEYDANTLRFEDGRVVAWFYEWDDFAGDPPYLAPEDAIVLAVGASDVSDGCLTMTGEPGWYRATAYVNGTVANEDCTEQGNPECEPEDEESVGILAQSNYVYVCECENETEARRQLGPPGGTPTPAPTSTPTSTPTPTPTPTSTPTPTATPPPPPTASPTATASPTPTVTATPTVTTSPPPEDAGGLDLPVVVLGGLVVVLASVLAAREFAI